MACCDDPYVHRAAVEAALTQELRDLAHFDGLPCATFHAPRAQEAPWHSRVLLRAPTWPDVVA